MMSVIQSVFDTKQSGRNRSLRFGYNVIELNNYKDSDGHVMFYFIKN